MAISEDFRPMTGNASFSLAAGSFSVPADERVSLPLAQVALS